MRTVGPSVIATFTGRLTDTSPVKEGDASELTCTLEPGGRLATIRPLVVDEEYWELNGTTTSDAGLESSAA